MDKNYKIKLDNIILKMEEKGYNVIINECNIPIIYYENYRIGYIDNSLSTVYEDDLTIIGLTDKGIYLRLETTIPVYMENIKSMLEKWKNYDYIQDVKAIPTKLYNAKRREYYLNQKPKEILYLEYNIYTEEEKCIKYVKRNGIKMRCYIFDENEYENTSLVSQFAYDTKTKKYYEKYVDLKDESTWIDKFLER